MFVFVSSAVGLLVISILGFFSNGLLNSWSTLFIFAHPELLTIKTHNSWKSFKILLYGAAILGYHADRCDINPIYSWKWPQHE